MISKAAELAARAERLTRQPVTNRPIPTDAEIAGESEPNSIIAVDRPTRPEQDLPRIRRAAPRAKPVRVSVDLAPQSYRGLLVYSSGLAEELGRAKVAHVEVIRALITELNNNPELQETIGRAVRAALSK